MTGKKNVVNDPSRWIDEYGDYLYNFAIGRVYSSETAEDLVQETFLSAVKGLGNFKGESTVKTWLTTILKRKIIDFYRTNAKRKEDTILDRMESPFEPEGISKGHWKTERGPQKWNAEQISKIENEEFMRVLQECLSKLPKNQAASFTLKEMEEMLTDEICKELGISSSNLWVLLHRAKLQLRECLEKKWFTL